MSKAQLSRLIDLPDSDLQQVLDYAATLSKAEAADHFNNLLGDSPMAVEFISAFNAQRQNPAGPGPGEGRSSAWSAAPSAAASASNSEIDAVPKRVRGPKKKKAALHTPAPRQITSTLAPPGAVYNKKDRQEDYISGRSGASTPASGISRSQTPVLSGAASPFGPPSPAKSATPPPSAAGQAQSQPKQPSQKSGGGGGGSLIQDALQPKSKKSSANAKAKLTIAGGTAMHGAGTALADFDAAIRALEVTTNPTLACGPSDTDVAARRCNCVATRHPLQTAAPNCTHCGKVVCVKEGLGPCTFCGRPLLSPADVQAMIKELRAERGREKMAADKAAHRKPDVAAASSKFARPTMIAGTTKWGNDDDFVSLEESAAQAKTGQGHARGHSGDLTAIEKARAHRDRLLAFQSENAQRTTVRDEAADFDVGDALAVQAGGSMRNIWASPAERARALQQQQKRLREQEWNARPEYERRQQVLSIDLAGRKVFQVRKAVAVVERPPSPTEEEMDEAGWQAPRRYDDDDTTESKALGEGDGNRSGHGGAFSKNPLLGRLIKPVYEPKPKPANQSNSSKKKGKGKGKEGEQAGGDGEEGQQENQPAVLLGRKDNPNAATRWRRVQDDLDNNESVILDGGLYGTAGPAVKAAGDEPDCG